MQSTIDDFKEVSHQITQILSSYLLKSHSAYGQVLQQKNATKLAEEMRLEKWIIEGNLTETDINEFMHVFLSNSQHLHHPHYIGHQAAGPHLASSIADYINGVVNNPVGIYEMGPSTITIEKVIVNWMLQKIGWFKGNSIENCSYIEGNGGGVLTHGGSMANLTALLAARAHLAPDAWIEGTPDDIAVLVPEVSHYSLFRAVSIIGLGQKSLIPIKVNKNEIVELESLYTAYEQALTQGKRVMAVVANACATSTGLYDPIFEMGQFCNENNIWFHVDGAHGASALLSERKKKHLYGVELADSMTWDAHKMLRTSTLCAAILVKDQQKLENTFRQKGNYLFHEKEQVGFDLLSTTIECTKSGLGNKVFWALSAEGEKSIGDNVEKLYDNADIFYKLISQTPDFECPYQPQSNILCFRYIKYGKADDFQLLIRNEVVKRGNFFITSTTVNGARFLRLAIMNPLTEIRHIENLMEEITLVAEILYSTMTEISTARHKTI